MSNVILHDDTVQSQLLSATRKMISRLIDESERSNALVVNSNSEILENWMKLHDDLKLTVDVNDLKRASPFKMRKIGATILHLRNYDDFEYIYNRIRTDVFLYDAHFIIIYEVAVLEEIEKMFSKFWKSYIFNVSVLVANMNSPNLVSLYTYMPFSNETCGNTEPVQINEFDKSSMEWTTNEFYPKKFKQLNRCPIRFGCYENVPGIIIDRDLNGSTKITGLNVDIGTMFSDILNFTLISFEYEQEMGVVYKNKTATAMIKKVLNNEVDVIFGSLQIDRVEALSGTRMVYTDKIILVVPPPFLIDPMTKIFLPFTFASWISIGMVALLACFIIKLMKFTPKIVHDYVIGRNVKGSMLNVCNVFLGGTQRILPSSNFPRFLLAKFLIFTLIMRSLYQGEVFNIMKRDVHTVKLDSFDEFIEHGYTFYIFKSLAGRLVGTKMMKRFVCRTCSTYVETFS